MNKSLALALVACFVVATVNYTFCNRWEVIRCSTMMKPGTRCLVFDRWTGDAEVRLAEHKMEEK